MSTNDDSLTEFELLTPVEAMRLLRVSRMWLHDAAKDERIPSIRLGGPGGPVRFVRRDLEGHIELARQQWRPTQSGAAALRSVQTTDGGASGAAGGEPRPTAALADAGADPPNMTTASTFVRRFCAQPPV